MGVRGWCVFCPEVTDEELTPSDSTRMNMEEPATNTPASPPDAGSGWFVQAPGYRPDIDGLRAIAVMVVIAFHFGYLSHGYLGVDVFFVISGFLITTIIYRESREGRFSLVKFYLRRIRRILPLVAAVNIAVLIVGAIVMLPDDLENLCQSVVATNLFSNNILQLITTRNYWDVVNEFKPLLHTWSLGVEEQYYMVYPLLFLLLTKSRLKWLPTILIVMTVASIAFYFSDFSRAALFYLLPFRFFELSLGGLAAVMLNGRVVRHGFTSVLVFALIGLLLFDIPYLGEREQLFLTVLATLGILMSSNSTGRVSSWVLENRLAVGVGLISYSLYMWHQPVVSFARYFVFEHIDHLWAALLTLMIFGISVISFYLVEQPFRDKKRVSTRTVLIVVGLTFVLTTSVAFGIYRRAGVIRDVPELDLSTAKLTPGVHSRYNHRIYARNKPFDNDGRVKVLVVGNSFSRDWANVLLESKFGHDLDLTYFTSADNTPDAKQRLADADFVFFSGPTEETLKHLIEEFGADPQKMWCVGPKNFGSSNGIYYNYRGQDYYAQRTRIEEATYEEHLKWKALWGDHYIDIIDKVIDDKMTVPIFTPDHRFISQDCRHFTRAGAEYFARLFTPELDHILGPAVAARSRPGSREPNATVEPTLQGNS
ncbi:MAG: acyltransferase family protein [Phycisphaera sp.]|nr:acyltransferase family protein [Phycisphaera sp.]